MPQRLLFIAWLACSACQDDYPLEPTPCDEWCDATNGFSCGAFDPAECVAHCETEGMGLISGCEEQFSGVLQCFRASSDVAEWCMTGGPTPCQTELIELQQCVGRS